jgi:trigger factor
MTEGLNTAEEGAAGFEGPGKKKEEIEIHPTCQVDVVGPCKKKLTVEIPVEDIVKYLQKSIGDLRKQAILPGFRKGHAPLALIEKRFGKDLRKEVKANLVVDGYQKALELNKLEPIAEPDINFDAIEMAEDKPLKYELAVEVWPDFEVKKEDYEGLKLEKTATAPTPAEIQQELEGLQQRTTALEEVKDEGAAQTDVLLCDYTVTSGDKQVAAMKEAMIRPEAGAIGLIKVEEIKAHLPGSKAGDSVNVAFKLADDFYQEEFRGKDALLAVNVKAVRRPRVPEANDAWAKELGFESLDELKTILTRNVEAAKESRADAALREQIYERLIDMLKFDLPEDAVRRQQKAVLGRERMGLQYRGATEEDLAKINDKLEEASLDKAQRDLKLFFILSRIAASESITSGEADVEMRIAEMAARYRTTVAKMRDHVRRENMLSEIALEIREEKTVAHILSKAEIVDATPAAEGEAEKPKAPKKPRVKKSDAKAEEKPEKPADQA